MKTLALIAIATPATLAASAAHAGWYDYWGNYHCVWGYLYGMWGCW